MNVKEIGSKALGVCHRIGFRIHKHSPEILMAAGIVGCVAGAVMACKATTKLNDILNEAAENLEEIQRAPEDESLKGRYSKEDAKRDTVIIYVQTAVKIAKLYAPAVGIGTLSIVSILTSHDILRKRNLALAAAYATVDKSFKEYRHRVVERFGESADYELRHGVKSVDIEKTVRDEDGGERTEKNTVNVADGPAAMSEYGRIFEEGNRCWDRTPGYNELFLRAEQNLANDILKTRGHLFLNEVYQMLGFEPTAAGQAVGWIYDRKNPDAHGDGYIDFGIREVYNPESLEDPVEDWPVAYLLDFNVDGDILHQGILEDI